MSLQALLDDEPLHSVWVETSPGAVDQAGISLHSLVFNRTIVGRYVQGNAHEREMWRALAVEISGTFLTLDPSVTFGEFLKIEAQGTDAIDRANLSEGRLFRVQAGAEDSTVYEKGNLDTHFRYPIQKMSRT